MVRQRRRRCQPGGEKGISPITRPYPRPMGLIARFPSELDLSPFPKKGDKSNNASMSETDRIDRPLPSGIGLIPFLPGYSSGLCAIPSPGAA